MNSTRFFIKGLSRVCIRMAIDSIHRVTINSFDTLFGFLNLPEKKLRIRIFILRTENPEQNPSPEFLDEMINYAKTSFAKNFKVELIPQGKKDFVEVLRQDAPIEALITKGGSGALREELKAAGNFFAANLTGIIYPVTVFVVRDIKGADGCSLGPMSDYITIDHIGLKNVSVLAHELAHACGLWHLKDKTNLLYTDRHRGSEVKWWQKNVFRSSRHVTYW